MKTKNVTIPKVGDWICAYQNGMLAIAAVRYIAESTEWAVHEGEPLYVTDLGTVRLDDILEVRRAV